MKTCTKCLIEKPLTSFVKRANRNHGYQAYCKECHNKNMRLANRTEYMRNYDLTKSYGITADQYNDLLEKQNGECAICNMTAEVKMKGKKKFLCVDHCHNTGKIRGLLCDQCNRAIGLLGDSIYRLSKAITYIQSA